MLRDITKNGHDFWLDERLGKMGNERLGERLVEILGERLIG